MCSPRPSPRCCKIIYDFKPLLFLSNICSISPPPSPRCWGSPASTANRRPLQGLQGGGTLSPSRYLLMEKEITMAQVINVRAYLFVLQAQHAAALSAASQYATQQAFQVKPGQAVPQVGRRSFPLGTFLFSIWILSFRMPPPHSPPGPPHF